MNIGNYKGGIGSILAKFTGPLRSLLTGKHRLGTILFWGAVLAVLVVQFSGIDFGLPGQYHPDEYFVNILTFHLFENLKTLQFQGTYYMLGVRWFYFAGLCLTFLGGFISGGFHTFSEFYSLYFSAGNPFVNAAPPLYYLVPRIISFLFYCSTILLVYLTLRKFTRGGPSVVAKAGTLLALILPAGYLYGHYGTRESAICFCSILAVYYAYFHLKPQRWSSILIGGGILGMAVSVKENGAIFYFLYCYFIVASWQRTEISGYRSLLACLFAGVIMTAVFALLNPQVFVPGTKLSIVNLYSSSPVRINLPLLHGFLEYPKVFIREFTFPGIVALVAGCVVGWLKKRELRPLIVIIVVSYLVLDCVRYNGLNKADRFIMNIFPLCVVAGMAGLSAVPGSGRRVRWLWAVPLIVAAGNCSELHSIFMVLNGHDTRDDARKWVCEHIPEGSTIAAETIYTPFLGDRKFNVIKTEWSLGNYPVDSLRSLGIDYLLISDRFQSGWMLGDKVRDNYATFLPFTIKTFEPLFKPGINDFHSPTITICKIR